MSGDGRLWTLRQMALACELHEAGYTPKQIAARMGLTVPAVTKRLELADWILGRGSVPDPVDLAG